MDHYSPVSDESRFLLYAADACLRVRRLIGEHRDCVKVVCKKQLRMEVDLSTYGVQYIMVVKAQWSYWIEM